MGTLREQCTDASIPITNLWDTFEWRLHDWHRLIVDRLDRLPAKMENSSSRKWLAIANTALSVNVLQKQDVPHKIKLVQGNHKRHLHTKTLFVGCCHWVLSASWWCYRSQPWSLGGAMCTLGWSDSAKGWRAEPSRTKCNLNFHICSPTITLLENMDPLFGPGF